jgi:hypothetical protein
MSREEQGQAGGMAGVMEALAALPDTRQVSQCHYPLNEMRLVALCGGDLQRARLGGCGVLVEYKAAVIAAVPAIQEWHRCA